MESKRVLRLAGCILAATLGAGAAPAQASGVWLSGGSSSGDGSVAIGFRGEAWGVEVGSLRNHDFSQEDVNKYPVPHNDFRILGNKRIDPMLGFDVLYFFPAWYKARFYGGAGLYMQKEALVAQSNVTGWLYEESSSTKYRGAASAGVQFELGSFVLGVGYHSKRGPNLSIGARW